VLTTFIDKTSTDKCWILDSGSAVHICSQKDMFNSLVAKKEETFEIVDGSACKIIGTGTITVTRRNGTVRALEAVRYVPEARYNLISISILDKEGYRIQVQ